MSKRKNKKSTAVLGSGNIIEFPKQADMSFETFNIEEPVEGAEENENFSFHYDSRDNEVDENSEGGDKKIEHKKLGEIILPQALQERFIKNLVLAGVVVVVTIVLLALVKTPQCCLGFAISGFLVYKAIELKYDYAENKILEITAICASVRYNGFRKMLHVDFREEIDEDIIEYYNFNIPERVSLFSRMKGPEGMSDFAPNHVYIIYFKESDPHTLLGYVEM